jgi:transketolase
MRNAFADEVTKLAATDERLVLLSGDIGNKLFDRLKAVREQAFLNCGIAEANMIGVAAGMAMCGLRPIVYTITPFTTTRCFEQIRVDVSYHRLPVTIVGTGSGLSYAELGPTHHSLEDLAILRTLPDMTVVAPCDSHELRQALAAALRQDGPVYIRIGKKGEPAIHGNDRNPVGFQLGRAIRVAPGKDVALLAAGTIMAEVLDAAKRLEAQGVSAEVVSFPTVKPLDEDYLAEAAHRFPLLVTVEEHGRIGGFGSAVAEWRATTGTAVPQLLLGAEDRFMHEVGDQAYARAHFGLDGASIAAAVLKRLGR